LAHDHPKGCRNRCIATDVDQNPEGGQVKNCSKEDKEFKATNFKNHEANARASDNTTEATQT